MGEVVVHFRFELLLKGIKESWNSRSIEIPRRPQRDVLPPVTFAAATVEVAVRLHSSSSAAESD